MVLIEKVKAAGRSYVKDRYGDNALAVVDYGMNYLLKPASPSSKPSTTTPGQVLGGTKLKRYLDRTYAKKCGVEVNRSLVATTSATLSTTIGNVITPFANIAQGDTDASRAGRSIEIKKLQLRLKFQSAVASTLPSTIRLLIIKGGKTTGGNIAGNDILETQTDIRSAYKLNQTVQYKVLLDKVFTVTPASNPDRNNIVYFTFNYTPKGCHEQTYTEADTTGVVTNIINGIINVKAMYEGGTAPTMQYYQDQQWLDL